MLFYAIMKMNCSDAKQLMHKGVISEEHH